MTAVAVGVYVASHLRAQSQSAPPSAAPLRTRIAIFNLTHVIKSYQKYVGFQTEMKEQVKKYEQELENLQKGLKGWQAQLQQLAPSDTAKRDEAERAVREYQRRMQDVSEDTKKQLGSRQDQQAMILYKEIETAVQRYAAANDIELVLHYNDAVSDAELHHPYNIQRKIQMGGCMPVYHARGMDITKPITDMLNQNYQASMAAPVPKAPGR
jgi:Skp family chaperone for outer membrane proteins